MCRAPSEAAIARKRPGCGVTINFCVNQGETGAAIGGTLYSGALSGSDGPASTYLDMMRHNATTLAQALGSQGSAQASKAGK